MIELVSTQADQVRLPPLSRDATLILVKSTCYNSITMLNTVLPAIASCSAG